MYTVLNKKNNLFVIFGCLFFLFHTITFSQSKTLDRLPEGYISSQLNSAYGLVFSDEYNSSLYLVNNGKTEKLLSAPGCGRYITINAQGDLIGLKLIDAATGLQAPAIYNLKEKKIIQLEDYTQNAGQVSFSEDGLIAYTYENNLVVVKANQKKKYDLGTYSNRAPIAPDGRNAIYKDNNEQIGLLNLDSGERKIVTDSKHGYANAVWSPDCKMIAYTTNGLQIFTTDLTTNTVYYIGEGENPNWLADSKQITFFNKEIDYQKVQLLNSDIYIAGSKGEYVNKITDTKDIFEMEPVYDKRTNSVLFNTYDKREIRSLNISSQSKQSEQNIKLKLDSPLKVEFFSDEMLKLKEGVSVTAPNYVHIHQVYDTREDWGEGRSCCGAASCMEAIASYGILPPSPITTYNHTSNYGTYISDPYTYRGYTYSGFIGWPSGGHGYCWSGSGSPYSNAASYLTRHGIISSRNDNVYFTTVTSELNQGFPYIVCSTGLTAGHIVMIVGQYGTGHTFYVNDPYGDKNIGSYGYIRNGKNAIYDWSDANTGKEKVTPVVWAITARCTPDIAPAVASYYPANNSVNVKSVDTVSITFLQMMDRPATEEAFTISPNVPGTLFWTNDDMVLNFKPSVAYDRLTKYTVTISTLAKNVFNKSLTSDFKYSFTTNNRNKLSVEKSYPAVNQTQISTTAQFRVQFDAPVTFSGLIGKIELYNSSDVKQTLASVKVTTVDGKGVVVFDPKNEMAKNSIYYILLNGKIVDAGGVPLVENQRISFLTEAEKYQSGTVIDNFEAIDNWKIQGLSSGSIEIDTNATSITLAPEKKISGLCSGKFAYSFTGSNGSCRILNSKKPDITGASSSEFGVWVFGDLSGNLLNYWFNIKGTETKVLVDTINWSGWKIKRIPFSAIGASESILFSGFSVSQVDGGAKTGTLYFDDAQYNVVLGVDSKNPNAAVMDYSLYQNYPNPFNPSTVISYEIGTSGKVSLKVFDVLGKEVANLVDEEQSKGRHSVEFSKPLSSGIYYYTLRAGEFTSTRKMVILK